MQSATCFDGHLEQARTLTGEMEFKALLDIIGKTNVVSSMFVAWLDVD
jgi:hypothetical protein